MTEPLVLGGLAAGALFGAAASLGDFCLLRGLRGLRAGGDSTAVRMFALALAVALAGTQWLAAGLGVTLTESLYVQPRFSLAAVLIGGILFGLGMVMANSCGARALVLGARGNLRSWVVLFCLGLSGYAMLRGVLSSLRQWLSSWGQVALPPGYADLASGLQQLSGMAPDRVWLLSGLLPGVALAAWALAHEGLRSRPRYWLSATGVGLAIIAGWFVTGYWAFDEFDPRPPVSLSYIAPVGQTLLYSMISTGVPMDFAVALVLGTILGAAAVALARRQMHWEGFDGSGQMLRYMAGGTLMGIGGVLAAGCTIGQGLTGLSTLAIHSFMAVAAIWVGACLGLRIFGSANDFQRGQ